MPKITRISYNSKAWQRPSGEARKLEAPGTYNHENGFGHEDWLFRSEWMIDGWRYAFIQGVNKSHAKLVREGAPIDLTLFTIQPDKKRRLIAKISGIEALSEEQAGVALAEFKRRGWYARMEAEIRAVNGNPGALGAAQWAKHVLNVRYRQDNVRWFPPRTYAKPDDPILKVTRYSLCEETNVGQSAKRSAVRTNKGSTDLPTAGTYTRRAVPQVEYTPEHFEMQAKLMQELKVEYSDFDVIREKDHIDVSVRTDKELILFEIKSDLDPRKVIREALGQILEYAYHPRIHRSPPPMRLVIVGRRKLEAQDQSYLDTLRSRFSLPLEYRVVSI